MGQHVSGWFLCRESDCSQCLGCPEAATVHHDCFKAFLQRCITTKTKPAARSDFPSRLWRFAAWRKPWKQAPPLLLPEDHLSLLRNHALGRISVKIDLPDLSKFPPELVRMIKKYSETAPFWSYTAAVDLADRFISTPSTTLLSVPMSDVVSWQRGGTPDISKGGSATASLPIIRLSIDSHGLRSVERFSEDQQPTFYPSRSSSMCFVVKHCSYFTGISALFQVGYRLI